MNTLRTAILLAGLTALFLAAGYLVGGRGRSLGVRPRPLDRR